MYTCNEEDFFLAYFSKITWNEKNSFDDDHRREYVAKLFNIEESKVRSIAINKKLREDFIVKRDFTGYEDIRKSILPFFKIFDYSQIEKSVLIDQEKVEGYIDILCRIFGESNLPETINISAIKSYISKEEYFYAAFVYASIVSDKIFIFVEDKNSYTDLEKNKCQNTLLHELAHLYLNKNSNFQEIFKNEWSTKYITKVNGARFRLTIEEFIVDAIINGNRDFGFAYKYLGVQEDLISKEKSFKGNKFRQPTLDFLEDLYRSTEDDKLEKFLPVYIEKIMSIGLFQEKESAEI